MTKALEKRLPPLYSQETVEDPIVVAHFFNPSGQGDWYIIEGNKEEDDYILYGLCHIFEYEFGYVSLNDLKSVKGPFGLGIERDMYWTERPVSEVRK